MRIVHQRSRSLAFTLVDLLIVIGTIVLLAILLPALSRPKRNHLPRIKCTSNLKQVGLAFRAFAQDHDDRYPFSVSALTNQETGVMISRNTINAEAWMHFQLLSNELSTAKVLMCPADQPRYKNRAEDFTTDAVAAGLAHPSRRDAAVSYFVGLHAEEIQPRMILTGDRNIAGPSRGRPYGVGRWSGVAKVSTNAVWSQAQGHQLHSDKSRGAGNMVMADGSVQQINDSGLSAVLGEAVKTNGPNANLFLFPR